MQAALVQSVLALLLVVGSNVGYLRQRAERNYFERVLLTPKCAKAINEKSTLPKSCGAGYLEAGGFMQVVEDLLEHQCDLVDPIRGQENKQVIADDQHVDFVVVGAGTAGSIVAGRLATTANKWNVALLEAGGPYPTGAMFPGAYFSYAKADADINWNFALEPQQYACKGYANGQCHWPRGKVLGGTGVQHGMMYMRGNPYDYNKWAAAGNQGWSYNDLLPYFKMSENNQQVGPVYLADYHGTSGPVTISQFKNHPKFAESLLLGGGQMGYNIAKDLNGKSQLGFTLAQATHNNGARLSMYNSYVAPLVGTQDNLIVSANSYVTKILFSADGKKAVGVQYNKNGATHNVYADKEVIIAGGAIQSPQILLLSGLGPKAQLQQKNINVVQDMPRVGLNLQNHVSYSIKFLVNESSYEELLNEDTLYQYLSKREGPMTSTGLSQTTGFIRVNELDGTPSTVPQAQMFFEGFLANCSQDGSLSGGNCASKRYITMTPTLLRPKSTGSITLRSNNPTDPPIIQANYLADPEERQTLVDAIKFTIKMSQTPALKDKVTIEVPPTSSCTAAFGSDDYWNCAITYWNNPENHQTGTCSMGSSTDNSVVDNELKVHGIDSLRVVDASIMPSVISGNVNGPIMMIAEKGADLIKKTWSAQ